LVERWQFGAIFNIESGGPISLSAGPSPFLNGGNGNFPDMVAAIPKDFGKVTKTSTPGVITYFADIRQVADPGRASLTTLQTLNTASTNMAIQDTQGNYLLINPSLGTIGNMGQTWLSGPGSYGMDANLVKRVRIEENKEFELRIDAINVLNHANFGNPTSNINSTAFGRIGLPTTGNRQFTYALRLNF